MYAEENSSDSDSMAFEIENFYDNGTNERGVKIFHELKQMFHCTSLSGISECVLKTMQLLELGRLEGDKGSSGFDTKTKSFQQRWFRMKAEKSLEKTDSKGHEARTAGEDGEV